MPRWYVCGIHRRQSSQLAFTGVGLQAKRRADSFQNEVCQWTPQCSLFFWPCSQTFLCYIPGRKHA